MLCQTFASPTPVLLVLGKPYPRLPFLLQNANVNLFANMHCPTSPSLIHRLDVLMHASLKIPQPMEYLIRGISLFLTFIPLSRPLREIISLCVMYVCMYVCVCVIL